jgi:RNA polymerase sigma factor (sigma-70 family)
MLADDLNKNFAPLLNKYGASLRAFFARRVSSSDAEDLVQEVFLKMQSTKFGSPIENLEGYIFSTARSVLIDHYRENFKQGSASAELAALFQGAYDALSPERIAIGQEEYLCVINTISELPPRTKLAFELHRYENLTYQAISERMGISRESVKDLMHRALVRIAEELRAVQ